MSDYQLGPGYVEPEFTNAGAAAQLAAQQRYFFGAVHPVDAEFQSEQTPSRIDQRTGFGDNKAAVRLFDPMNGLNFAVSGPQA